METALIARYDATRDPVQSLRPKEVELVRANDPAKPDAGDLVNRQQLLQRGFGWFHQVASLRELRSVHPERTRSANPQPVTQADVPVAEGLFREMLSGWRNSMLETRSLAQQSSQPTAYSTPESPLPPRRTPTPEGFTKGAIELAKSTGVQLIGRKGIAGLLQDV